MKHLLPYIAISIFSIFIGSQITEGVILVPYWKSLSPTHFYAYYNQFGPIIGRFYTILTIVAALIPIAHAIYCKFTNTKGLKLALISSFFAVLFIASFYVYFKGTNELFYRGTLSDLDLATELVTWSYWHWGRVFIEGLSLVFLILAFRKVQVVS